MLSVGYWVVSISRQVSCGDCNRMAMQVQVEEEEEEEGEGEGGGNI